MKKELLQKIHAIEPIARIGKNGLTENLIKELKNHLKKRKLIKVKMLKSFIGNKNRKELAKEIADKTDSKLVHQVGFVVVLKKEE